MPEIILCPGIPRVSIDGYGNRTLLVIQNGTSVRFWMETARLQEALAGEALQVSADDGYLYIEGLRDVVRLELRLAGMSVETCEVPKRDVEMAIEVVRAEVLREVDNPQVRVEET